MRLGTGHLDLPVRPACPEDDALPAFELPVAAPATPHKKLRLTPMRRTIQIDLATNEMVYTLRGDGGEFEGATLTRIEEIDLEIGYRQLKRYRILEDDPLSAETELVQHALLRRDGWLVQVDCRTRLTATEEAFRFTADVEAYEDDRPFAQRSWTLTLPRKLV